MISITDQTEENLETLEPETELDPPTKSLGKIIRFKPLIFFLIIEMEMITKSEVERRSSASAETKLDLTTESLGKTIYII